MAEDGRSRARGAPAARPGAKRTRRVVAWLAPDEAAALEDVAFENGETTSNAARRLIVRGLGERGLKMRERVSPPPKNPDRKARSTAEVAALEAEELTQARAALEQAEAKFSAAETQADRAAWRDERVRLAGLIKKLEGRVEKISLRALEERAARERRAKRILS